VVIGDAFHYQRELIEFQQSSRLNIKIFKNLSAQQMADIMSECRYSICPPSTVSYEYLSVRGGELYVKITADNQKDTNDFYKKNGIAFDISELFVNDPLIVQQCLDNQRKCFDGQSTKRLQAVFRRLKNEKQLKLRKTKLSDIDLYFHWVNDFDARQNAILTEQISYEEHCFWFEKKVISKDAYLWVLEQDGTPVGQIRFDVDRTQRETTISYFIAKEYRGNGIGLSVVKMGLELFCKSEKEIIKVNAIVKSTNEASRRIFNRLNFRIHTDEKGFLHYIKSL
jgi:RimJ/RimL family protein N-acetyltransferase